MEKINPKLVSREEKWYSICSSSKNADCKLYLRIWFGDLCLPPESWLPRRDLPKAKYIFCAPTIHQPQKVKRDHKVKKGLALPKIPSCQLLAMSTEPGERVVNECQRNVCRTKTNRGWEFRLEAYLSNLYLFYSDLAIREAIKNMLSISDKRSKLQTDPAAATILLF